MTGEPSIVRRSIDRLLAAYPAFDVVRVEWQEPAFATEPWGAWVLVTLGQPSEDHAVLHPAWARHPFAIWRNTGAVHGIDHDGAVIDPPLFPADS